MRLPDPIQKAIDWLIHELPKKLPERVDPRVAIGVIAGVAVLGVIVVIASSGGSSERAEVQTRVVTVAVETDDANDAPVGPLGFPVVATRNTTRVNGPDAATDAAAIALATHPPSPAAPPVGAAILVGPDDWQGGIAASVLTGAPVGAPVLVGEADGVPEPTADALAKLNPEGSGPSDAAVYAIGDVAEPTGYRTERVKGDSPAEVADSIDLLRQELVKSDPAHILIASSDQAPYAMPAAGWAARSGDPVLLTGRDEVPAATTEALQRHRGTPVYVLGPENVITAEAVRAIERVAPGAQRVGEDGPTENSIAFARYVDSDFGWNINDPGHGLVLASAGRPLDAAAAAPLSASGTWGPLLVIEDAASLPAPLRSFLLDIKPGFEDDPTRAVYNHVWVVGDSSAVGARVQAEVDQLAELAEVGSGAGGAVIEGTGNSAGVPPQDAENEPVPSAKDDQGKKKP